MAGFDKVRILVLGDSGVGKTSLVHLISHGEPLPRPQWTIGCSVEVLLHEYKAGTPAEKTYFVELWDVGGSPSHANSRNIFYHPCNGVILVYDVTNGKSEQNLRKWFAEVLSRDARLKASSGADNFDSDLFNERRVPILAIGTKSDLSGGITASSTPNGGVIASTVSAVASSFNADEILLDCLNSRCIAPGSSTAVRLSRFFDKTIERRFYSSRDSPFHSPFAAANTFPVSQRRTANIVDKAGHGD